MKRETDLGDGYVLVTEDYGVAVLGWLRTPTGARSDWIERSQPWWAFFRHAWEWPVEHIPALIREAERIKMHDMAWDAKIETLLVPPTPGATSR